MAQTVHYLALVLAETAKQSPLTEFEKVHPGVGCKKWHHPKIMTQIGKTLLANLYLFDLIKLLHVKFIGALM